MILGEPRVVPMIMREHLGLSGRKLSHAEVIGHLLFHPIVAEDVVKLLEDCICLCFELSLALELSCDESR